MAENEWNILFANQAMFDQGVIASPGAINLAQDEFSATETETEDRVSVAPSVYSLTSSLRDQSFRKIDGRSLNAHSDVYFLPADEEEARRLHTQHDLVFLLSRNDHYYGMTTKVREVPLDLGTMHCATDFPHADVLGVDIAPTSATAPPNCRFEIDDLNLGLNHFFGPTFDLIHARLLNSGVKDYAGLVDQISRCLRPGGLAIFAETDFRIWSEDKRILIPPNFYTPLPTQRLPSLGGGLGSTGSRSRMATVSTKWAVPTWMATMNKCIRAKGGNINSAMLLKTWMRDHPNYIGVQTLDRWAPLGPWKATAPSDWTEHPNFNRVGEMTRNNLIGLMSGARPLLYEWFSETEVAKLENDALCEVKSAANPVYIRMQISWGSRRGA